MEVDDRELEIYQPRLLGDSIIERKEGYIASEIGKVKASRTAEERSGSLISHLTEAL